MLWACYETWSPAPLPAASLQSTEGQTSLERQNSLILSFFFFKSTRLSLRKRTPRKRKCNLESTRTEKTWWQFASEINWPQQKCLLLVAGLCYLCHEHAISPWLCSPRISKHIQPSSKLRKTRAQKTVAIVCPKRQIQTLIHSDSEDF